jgi:hypothetical protein
MTDETDIRSEDADSGRTTDEKLEAEVIAKSGPANDPDVYLVEYPDGSQEYEPSTPTNTALFEDGLYGDVQGHSEFFNISTGVTVELDADVENRDYVLTVEGTTIPVPSDRAEDVIDAFRGGNTGSNLYGLYEDIIEGQVRRHIVEQFIDRFPEDRVEQTPEGWVVDDTFIVTYEGTNHLTDLDPTDPYSNETDESKQAVYLDINATENREIVAPDGERVELTPQEQEFITQVEGLLYPEDYFGVELVDEIEQHKAEGEVLDDVIEDLTEQASVTGFTDSKTGIHHGSTNHDFRKHDVRDLNVTDDVRDKLWSNPYDHAGVHELLLRKQEFINNPDIEVFRDADDTDSWKWNEIENTSESAPIPPEVRNKLDNMFA